jgi:hypothetical protein
MVNHNNILSFSLPVSERARFIIQTSRSRSRSPFRAARSIVLMHSSCLGEGLWAGAVKGDLWQGWSEGVHMYVLALRRIFNRVRYQLHFGKSICTWKASYESILQ